MLSLKQSPAGEEKVVKVRLGHSKDCAKVARKLRKIGISKKNAVF